MPLKQLLPECEGITGEYKNLQDLNRSVHNPKKRARLVISSIIFNKYKQKMEIKKIEEKK